MDQAYRTKLDLHCDDLVPKIDLARLLPKLIDNGVYNDDDIKMNDWKNNLKDINTVKEVYTTIKTRGPHAFGKFIISLRQSGHEHLAAVLDVKKPAPSENVNNNNNDNNNTKAQTCNGHKYDIKVEVVNEVVDEEMPKDDYHEKIFKADSPLKVKVRKAKKFLDLPYDGQNKLEKYPMRSDPRGYVLIVNNFKFDTLDDRVSSNIDVQNLEDLFSQMGFCVTICENLTGKKLKEVFERCSKQVNFNGIDSFFAIVCSHGSKYGENYTSIHCTDWPHEIITDADLVDYFQTSRCPSLVKKPKVFIFQTCRGNDEQPTVTLPRTITDGLESNLAAQMSGKKSKLKRSPHREQADCIVIYATTLSHVAHRDKLTGSWVISILCEVFMNHAHEEHLLTLLTMADARLENVCRSNPELDQHQTIQINWSGFNKELFLNPGLNLNKEPQN